MRKRNVVDQMEENPVPRIDTMACIDACIYCDIGIVIFSLYPFRVGPVGLVGLLIAVLDGRGVGSKRQSVIGLTEPKLLRGGVARR